MSQQIYITVEGGVIQDIVVTPGAPLEVYLMDCDVYEGVTPRFELFPVSGTGCRCGEAFQKRPENHPKCYYCTHGSVSQVDGDS